MLNWFKPRPNAEAVMAAAADLDARLGEAISLYSELYRSTPEFIDESVRRLIECQMFVVSLSTSLWSGCLTDAYYDMGRANPAAGLPNIKFDHDTMRSALRRAWQNFSPVTRMNLDARYRYIYVAKLLSPAEQQLFALMEEWSEEAFSQTFRFQQPLRFGWVKFIDDLGQRDKAGALAALSDYSF